MSSTISSLITATLLYYFNKNYVLGIDLYIFSMALAIILSGLIGISLVKDDKKEKNDFRE